MPTPQPPLITTTQDLKDFLAECARSPYLALDTEFLRERTYYAKLCLIQVATDDVAAAIDPLAKNIDLKPFLEFIQDPSRVKVFHAGKQDLEIFYNLSGKVPTPVFDTQIAAMALGMGEQIGYAPMIQKMMSLTIDKGQQLTNWERRPLNEAQLAYAMDDVLHLRFAYKKMLKDLEKKNRLSWVDEEHARLTDPKELAPNIENCWEDIRTRDRTPRTVTALKELAMWREQMAQKFDRVRHFLIRDEALSNIARARPTTEAQLENLRGIPMDFVKRYKDDILRICQEVEDMPERKLLKPEKASPIPNIDGEVKALANVYLRSKCEEVGINARLVCNSDELSLFLGDKKAKVPLRTGWRWEHFGKDLELFQQGKLALTLDGKKMKTVVLK